MNCHSKREKTLPHSALSTHCVIDSAIAMVGLSTSSYLYLMTVNLLGIEFATNSALNVKSAWYLAKPSSHYTQKCWVKNWENMPDSDIQRKGLQFLNRIFSWFRCGSNESNPNRSDGNGWSWSTNFLSPHFLTKNALFFFAFSEYMNLRRGRNRLLVQLHRKRKSRPHRNQCRSKVEKNSEETWSAHSASF